MTPAEFRAARKSFGLTQAALAADLGLKDGRTIRRWESGERPIPGPVCIAIEALLTGWRPENWPGPELGA